MTFNRFQRMVAIPEEEYQHLKSLKQTHDPLQTKFLSLSSDYNQQGLIENPQARVMRQGETLNQMIDFKDRLRQRLIGITPRAFKSRADSLFQFIGDKMKVNESGEIHDADGGIIGGSNIADLIQHAVRDRRCNIVTPPGWSRFLRTLKSSNTPRTILNYDTLDEMDGKPGVIAATKPSKLPLSTKVTKGYTPVASPIKIEEQEAVRKSDRKRRDRSTIAKVMLHFICN